MLHRGSCGRVGWGHKTFKLLGRKKKPLLMIIGWLTGNNEAAVVGFPKIVSLNLSYRAELCRYTDPSKPFSLTFLAVFKNSWCWIVISCLESILKQSEIKSDILENQSSQCPKLPRLVKTEPRDKIKATAGAQNLLFFLLVVLFVRSITLWKY